MLSAIGLTVAYSISALISVAAALAVIRRREVRGGRAPTPRDGSACASIRSAIAGATSPDQFAPPVVSGRTIVPSTDGDEHEERHEDLFSKHGV